MNHSTAEFESAMLMHGTLIIEIEKPEGVITEASGFINGFRYTWNGEGQCFYKGVPEPEYDLEFKGIPKFYCPKTRLTGITASKRYLIKITRKGFEIIDDFGTPKIIHPIIKLHFLYD